MIAALKKAEPEDVRCGIRYHRYRQFMPPGDTDRAEDLHGAARAGSSTYRVKILGRRRAQYDRGIGRRDRSKMARLMLARERRGGMMAGDRCNFPHMFFLSQASHVEDDWQPRADVYRTREGWLVKLELAGVKADEIQLAAEGRRLLVQGTRRDEHCVQGMGCHCMEIAYSRFQRVLELPDLSESAEIVTSYVDGMLLVRIRTERGS